jgi:hypothetical protein
MKLLIQAKEYFRNYRAKCLAQGKCPQHPSIELKPGYNAFDICHTQSKLRRQNAKQNNYKQILILEDDIIPIKNFNEEFNNLINNINNNWDFIYCHYPLLMTIQKSQKNL